MAAKSSLCSLRKHRLRAQPGSDYLVTVQRPLRQQACCTPPHRPERPHGRARTLSDARGPRAPARAQAAAADPRCARAHYRRGVALAQLGRPGDAAVAFRAALAGAPGSARLQAALAGAEAAARAAFQAARAPGAAAAVGDAATGTDAQVRAQRHCSAACARPLLASAGGAGAGARPALRGARPLRKRITPVPAGAGRAAAAWASSW